MLRQFALTAFVLAPAAILAQVTAIGPFAGAASDSYESSAPAFYTSLGILGGMGTVDQLGPGQGINLTTGWSFFSLITPHSGNQFIGGAGSNYSFNFSTPAFQFGGYFATNADSPGAVATFYDSSGAQIGGPMAVGAPLGQWQWDGWQYAGGISRIDIVANNQFAGFIMSDDIQYNAVPEPASMLVLGLGLAAISRRRKRSR